MASRRITVALAQGEALVLVSGVDAALSVPVTLPPAAEDPTAALLQLFVQIQESLADPKALGEEATGQVQVRVALLPPLSDARLVVLPPLRDEETDAVLRRDAQRHFLGSGRPLIVGGARFGAASGGTSPVLAVAAPRTLVEGLQRAVESVGWELDRIVGAHACWLHAHAAMPAASTSDSAADVRTFIAIDSGTAHVLRVVGGVPEQIRRVPAADQTAVLEAVGSGPGRALLLSDAETRAALAEPLAQKGWVLAKSADPSARLAAARHAGDAFPELVPTPLAWARKERSRQSAVRMVAAAIIVLAVASAVHLLGIVRDYNAVRRERQAIREAVLPALAARDSLDQINERLDELKSLGLESARWTFSLVELSVLLPPETHMISLRAAGDTAIVEAQGGRAGDALSALRTATTLEDVRIEGTIEREIEDGTASGERFTLSAVLAPRRKAADAEPPAQAPAPADGRGP